MIGVVSKTKKIERFSNIPNIKVVPKYSNFQATQDGEVSPNDSPKAPLPIRDNNELEKIFQSDLEKNENETS